jgi:hypothetical protein
MKRVTSGIRNDRLRRLYKTALKQGWAPEIDGKGHVVLRKGDQRFSISTTSSGGSMGHHYENTRAAARRAGMDVSEL